MTGGSAAAGPAQPVIRGGVAAAGAMNPVVAAGPAAGAVAGVAQNPRSTSDCVQFLRELAPSENTTYVFRGCDLQGKHPFEEANFTIWGPEEDTSIYYGALQPMALGVAVPAGTPAGTPREGQQAGTARGSAAPALEVPIPPSGVDAGAFYDLVDMRRQGYADNLLNIDAAANNTSVVFCLEWRGYKLLFPGDAEQKSWQMMSKQSVFEPVHFLKIGHHGSSNGSPVVALMEKILPLPKPADGKRRCAVVSTCLDTYHNVPSEDTLKELARRCDTIYSVADLKLTIPNLQQQEIADGGHLDIEFEG